MYRIDFNKPLNIHFIGIGGISMSGLAEILLGRGFAVSGSDRSRSELTARLEEKGALVFYGQRAENIPDNCDVVVYTAAIHEDNPEFAEAVRRCLPMMTRAELLGELMDNFGTSVAVAGTHGKTTTTAMLSHILLAADTDPTITIGGMLGAIGGNIRVGKSPYFLTEACEYTNSFLSLRPRVGVILNVERDHLDFFKNLENIRASFLEFARLVEPDGTLVINSDIDDVSYFTRGLKCSVSTFSVKGHASYQASGVSFDGFARASFSVVHNGAPIGEISLKVPGEHNISNALAAVAAADALNIAFNRIRQGLEAFTGTDRRFQIKGRFNGAAVIDDYAHHPTEIRATLTAAKNCPHKKLVCVFQPHTYSRTVAFLEEFADALSLADEVIMAEIYSARETNTFGVSSRDIAKLLNEKGTPSEYFETFDEIENALKNRLCDGDIVITMGAGDVYEIGDALLKGDA